MKQSSETKYTAVLVLQNSLKRCAKCERLKMQKKYVAGCDLSNRKCNRSLGRKTINVKIKEMQQNPTFITDFKNKITIKNTTFY